MRRARFLLVTAAACAIGCAVTPPRVEPRVAVSLPADGWTTSTAPGDLGPDWWSTFDDPQLARLIATALERNYDLQAAAARLERAMAQARIAGADLRPSVGAGLNALRQRQNFVGLPLAELGGADPAAADLPSVVSTVSERFELSLDTSWEIDLWGRLRAGARAALAEARAADADLAGARLSIAGRTAQGWFAVVEAHEQVELARRSAESFGALAAQVRSRYESGLRPAVELRLALSNLAAAEALLERRSEELDRRTRQLEVLLGRYPAGDLRDVAPPGRLPSLDDPPPAGLPAELLSRRPDLVAAERRLAAADQRVLEARRALYPRLSLTASGGTVSDQARDLLDGDFRVWSLIGNLLQPLYQGGRLRAGVDLAEALEDERVAGYAGAVLQALAEVESALSAELRLRARERHVAETARQLIAARQLAEDRYREGVGDYLTVLESQTRALVAESDRIALRRALLANRVELYLALGGGFAADGTAPGPRGAAGPPENEEPVP